MFLKLKRNSVFSSHNSHNCLMRSCKIPFQNPEKAFLILDSFVINHVGASFVCKGFFSLYYLLNPFRTL